MSGVPLAVRIQREDVLHFLGYGRGRGPGARIEEALGAVLDEARALAAPQGLHRILAPGCAGALGLEPRSRASLAVGLVTIGRDLEQRVTALLAEGEATHALLLDAAGSAAAEEAAGELERLLRGERPSRRFSPGYGSWPLTAQRALFDLLPHAEIGVRLLPSCLMTPRKSVSFALWLGAGEDLATGEEPGSVRCETCGLVSCPYRRHAPAEETDPSPGEEA